MPPLPPPPGVRSLSAISQAISHLESAIWKIISQLENITRTSASWKKRRWQAGPPRVPFGFRNLRGLRSTGCGGASSNPSAVLGYARLPKSLPWPHPLDLLLGGQLAGPPGRVADGLVDGLDAPEPGGGGGGQGHTADSSGFGNVRGNNATLEKHATLEVVYKCRILAAA